MVQFVPTLNEKRDPELEGRPLKNYPFLQFIVCETTQVSQIKDILKPPVKRKLNIMFIK